MIGLMAPSVAWCAFLVVAAWYTAYGCLGGVGRSAWRMAVCLAGILESACAKQSRILEAEAQAEAIMKVQQATADAIKLINEANPGDGVLKIKALEAFTAAANGKATKIIIPSEIQGLAGLAASAKTIFDTEDPKATITETVPKQ